MTANGWFLSLKPVGSPERRDGDAAQEEHKAHLVSLWSQHIAPVAIDGDSDFEDFYEQAARLDALLLSVPADEIWVDTHDGDDTVRNLGTGERLPESEVADLPRFGMQDTRQEWIPAMAEARAADGYASLAAFHRNAGRLTITCGHNVEDGSPELIASVLQIAGAAGGRVLIKATRAKRGFWLLDVPPNSTPESMWNLLADKLDWTLIQYEGAAGAFLAQQWQPMYREYRIFVVGGQLITGAGAIEEFTPLNNKAPFDAALRRDRASASPVSDGRTTVRRLMTFATTVAREIEAESPDLRNYVMDVAVDAVGNPLVVELNSLLNSGLYATDPRLVVQALVEQYRRR